MTEVRVSGVPYMVDIDLKLPQRISVHEWLMGMAQLTSRRATCIRRQVGCILVNDKQHIIATGYNGPPSGAVHCTHSPCEGALSPSGTDLDKCDAVHAEINALLQCHNVQEIVTAYVTVSPCIHCVKVLLNTSCKNIIFLEEYSHPESEHRWKSMNRSWTKFDNLV